MSRPLKVIVELTVPDDANDEQVADFVMDLVCGGGDVEANEIPYETCDGTTWE